MSEAKTVEKSYRQFVKSTSLFGGVQVFVLLIGIIKSKAVAVLLGTTGMGITGLYATTLSIIQSLTGLGISASAIRNIADAHNSGDSLKIAKVFAMLRRWVWFTGLLGAFITLSLAPLLSQWTFGSEDYTWGFIFLSVICLFSSLSSCQNALLQGMRRLQDMAKSTAIGALLGLITAIPLFYFFGYNGIIPSLVVSAICTLLLSWYYSRKIEILKIHQTWSESYHDGLDMVKLGVAMMLSGFMTTLSSYIITLFIGRLGGISQVGLYRSGWTIAMQYTAMIFTAMGTDYYPRLIGAKNDNKALCDLSNQQAEISFLFLTPLLVGLIGFAPFVVQLFYTADFLPIIGLIKWSMLGMLCKGGSWAFAFTIIAKNDKKLFFITESVGNLILLGLNLCCYYIFGLKGIGISFFIGYSLYFVLVVFLTNRRYGLRIYWKTLVLLMKSFMLLIIAFLLTLNASSALIYYISAALVLVMATLFCLYELNKRIELISIIQNLISRIKQ